MVPLEEEKTKSTMEYIEALEEERRKMEVFHRELPLCVQLVTQAIESIKNGEDCPVKSGEVLPTPVLEEFIPLKPSLSSFDGEDRQRCHETTMEEKPDWLRSVQLWSQEPEPELELEKKEGGQSPTQRKARRSWSPELHRKFLHALEQLGGSHVATPKQIREIMKVDGLTNDEVKSHLQKYRLHTKRSAPAVPISGNSSAQTPHFMVVSGIWVQPIEFASTTLNGTTSSSSQMTTVSPADEPKS
ncbi:transcription factor HHO3-like [Dioscorea cayenensis subsp. rotundata]|uniref:Transcription factor HHO3-like n=1 Tax=Dioscorea cayennensis subsp. rotundata TaxID=55577 RepID=A0AB40CXG1_DIOCR|nr:transcription factor HHO3-like [Dioscorea cayenensis subsp. rotundata]